MSITTNRKLECDFIKNTANIITLFRIIFAIAMVFTVPFSIVFWIFYLCCGLSDLIDGFVARKMKQQSVNGAKLDSISDMFFAIAIALVIIINITFPTWLWLCMLCIALLRVISYGIGFYKYHTFASLHTYGNKVTGMLLFVSPILYILLGLTAMGIILCVVAFISALEEVIITIKSKELNRDCKSLFVRLIRIWRGERSDRNYYLDK